jgi:NAD(P)-dependent dehydrogenase (short-subunit alcohol dehydrogenase family)
MNVDGIVLVTGGSRGIGAATATLLAPASSAVTGINLPVDAGFIAGSTWDAYGGWPETPDA